jgi:hypothetical protein
MISLRSRCAASVFTIGVCLAMTAPAQAQSLQFTTPHTTTAAGTTTVTLNGISFANQGLIGVGRLDANVRDFAGETLGSFSSMALDLHSWHRNADGSYGGLIYTLPDRGPNGVGPFTGTTNYRNRVHTSQITFTPYTSSAVLPQSTSSQSQLTITPTGGFFLADTTGTNFTGKDAGETSLVVGDTVITRNGIFYPRVLSGDGAGRISLDSEGIAFRLDGSFYVSDEYAANIYYFDSTGHQIGALNTVSAILPRISGVVDFNGSVTPTTGRRNNQGLEAMAITPDNKRLVTILQSATVQDTNGSNQQTRNNTRILVYDISGSAVPNPNPIGEYVLQLPTFTANGGGGAVNRTAAQSEMLALNSNQFLVLSRDGGGRGSNSTNPIVFKSVLLVDITGATNLAGTAYETGTTPLAVNGNLVPGITPAAQVELVNMLNVTQLNKFGMNLNANPSTVTSLSEKWEAMGLASVLEESAPQDFFLFIGNDNDFEANNGFINGQSFDASVTTGGIGNNDSVILVYRLTLPTYVDPIALEALETTGPDALYGTRVALNGMAASTTQPAMRFLNAQRGWGNKSPRHAQLWIDDEWNKIGSGIAPLSGLDLHMLGMTIGVDVPFGTTTRLGAFAGFRTLDGKFAGGAPLDANAWTAGAYFAVELPSGLYIQASAAGLGSLKFSKIGRDSVYGQRATGKTDGSGWAGSAEIGWALGMGKAKLTPFAAVDHSHLKLDSYTETGASVSNLTFPDRSFGKTSFSLGGEAALDMGAFRPAIRVGYSFEHETGDHNATVRLASAQHVMGTEVLPLADTERDSAFTELRLGFHQGSLSGFVSGRGRWGRGDDDARVSAGLSLAF